MLKINGDMTVLVNALLHVRQPSNRRERGGNDQPIRDAISGVTRTAQTATADRRVRRPSRPPTVASADRRVQLPSRPPTVSQSRDRQGQTRLPTSQTPTVKDSIIETFKPAVTATPIWTDA
ncbi:unnamed protein product [Nesidiocoris tenuis]|uniref:Uncharacterized protein n=1 Tax=Nesidiocoris tenuis TaxID=355587 RepID=A0A6H5G669_9HEMI|nr:unnamed protein product [Nesidiocoris tenuis]